MEEDEKSLEPLYTSYLKEELRLDREGQWYHSGQPFTHERLSQLFHRSVQWDEELQEYVIRIGKGRATFSHEGFVRFITSLSEDSGTLIASFADGAKQMIPPEDIRLDEHEQFVLLENGKPTTRFTRSAHQQLLEHAESERSLAIGDTVYTIPFLHE